MAPETRDLNARLQEVARALYGDRATLRLVDPAKLRLLTKNARFMKKATFEQLAQNVQQDGMLQSVPLCHGVRPGSIDRLKDDELEVLSGNHRVKSAIRAGLSQILVLVIPHQDREQKIARQLSHNALAGQDDKQLLAELWREMDDLQAKLYSGLDSETVAELEKVNFAAFNAAPIRTEKVVLWFLPEEVGDLEKLLDEAAEVVAADKAYLAPLASYRKLFDLLVKVKKLGNIKNTAVAFLWLIDQLGMLELEPPADEAEGTAPKA